jgi:DNA polymerase III alpha subunit
MKKSKFGELIFSDSDLCDLTMQGYNVYSMTGIIVDESVQIEQLVSILEDAPESLITWTFPDNSDVSIPDWDRFRQDTWYIPDAYKNLDIAEHVLTLCKTNEELQRVGQELLLFQERNLFGLLRYLKYLVDVMKENRVIWGVGRGSSVASYVLYLLEVHQVDSLHYDLDPTEFLR